MKTCVDTWLALVVLVAAVAKARRAGGASAELTTYGLHSRLLQNSLLWSLIVLELGLSVALIASPTWGAIVTAGLFGVFTIAATGALLAGRGGRPCACFGGGSRLSWWTPLRSCLLALTAVAVSSGWLPDVPAGYARWLTVGFAACAAAVVGLGLVVLALAREVGVLRLGIASQGALEIAEEGPALGSSQPWAAALPWHSSSLVGLAIFTSDGCPLCHQLVPAVRHVAADPLLAVAIFDEVNDAAVWAEAAVPGSPYAVALETDGVARAKGTFNSLPQLESIIAAARSRSREITLAA
jgi:hypothetical protein